jgi:ankyrin repeat protein
MIDMVGLRCKVCLPTGTRRCLENSDFEAVVELLLNNNCGNVNSKDTNGRTQLSWAAGEGHPARLISLHITASAFK